MPVKFTEDQIAEALLKNAGNATAAAAALVAVLVAAFVAALVTVAAP